ncbi:TetR/AcrR family transcriptional regulator [Paenibacillus sp. PAMC21692]|uniref:TetR/AcrR family transcriptional regulator n=1 Tax=Paenibacillus sp. PAMC21692 TaxID=2762320 RepID=UPI00164ED0A0|nr:TetR family transcriptional regulator [Paenibacillus sp. PAMC21692]QNK59148.1 TetR/AcrR family transcriptional regulator [Paenibacillus sp. PAMC21692]
MSTIDEMDVKRRIVTAAKRLFAKHGFEGTSIRQICEEAGANVALVSYHFGGKESLFGALFETEFPNNRVASVNPDMDPVAGVKLVIREVTAFRQSDPLLITIIQQEIIMNTPRIQKIREHVMPMWGLLRKWIKEGRERGLFEFRSVDTAFMSVVGTLLFHRNQEYWSVMLEEGQPDLETMTRELTEFILRGLHYKAE